MLSASGLELPYLDTRIKSSNTMRSSSSSSISNLVVRIRSPAQLFGIVAAISLVSIITLPVCLAGEYAVFKSVDQGRTWKRSDNGLPHEARVNAFGSLGQTVFAGTDLGIFISRDEGKSWDPSVATEFPVPRVLTFASLGERTYAGTDGHGILVSTDCGTTWEPIPFPAKKVRCLIAVGDRLYAGTENKGVLVSEDQGITWKDQSSGLPESGQIFDLASANGHLFAGLYAKGLYSWDEQDRIWRKRGPVSPLVLAVSRETLVAGHNPGGLFYSQDLGMTWHKGKLAGGAIDTSNEFHPADDTSSDAPVWELGANELVVLAGAASGIYRSKDQGQTWVRATSGLPKSGPGISFFANDDFVLAGIQVVDWDHNDSKESAGK